MNRNKIDRWQTDWPSATSTTPKIDRRNESTRHIPHFSSAETEYLKHGQEIRKKKKSQNEKINHRPNIEHSADRIPTLTTINIKSMYYCRK